VRAALTGTPGTGKTTVTDMLAGDGEPSVDLAPIHLNDLIEAEGLYEAVDEERDSLVADLNALAERLADRDDVLIESHLAHHLPADRVIVLRCRPEDLANRLRERGAAETEVAENAESEALDVILAEAVERHDRDAVYEIDTTGETPKTVAAAVAAVVAGDRDPAAGTVDFTEYL
jgi:adenylate kinase